MLEDRIQSVPIVSGTVPLAVGAAIAAKLQNTTDVESSSLEAQQALQQYQINYLNKQIKNAQDIINNERIVEESKNYKPIKVYSSCSLNTDGSLTTEEPVKNEFKSINPLEPNVNSFNTFFLFGYL